MRLENWDNKKIHTYGNKIVTLLNCTINTTTVPRSWCWKHRENINKMIFILKKLNQELKRFPFSQCFTCFCFGSCSAPFLFHKFQFSFHISQVFFVSILVHLVLFSTPFQHPAVYIVTPPHPLPSPPQPPRPCLPRTIGIATRFRFHKQCIFPFRF